MTPSRLDLPDGLTESDWMHSLRDAAARWNVPCSPYTLTVSEPISRLRAERDEVNLIVFRSYEWCHNEHCGGLNTYPLRAMGMSTPYTGSLEVDVELNATSFTFATPDAPTVALSGRKRVPLVAVLMHEFGHVLGLRDLCVEGHYPSGAPTIGQCSDVERRSVMFAAALAEAPSEADIGLLCKRP